MAWRAFVVAGSLWVSQLGVCEAVVLPGLNVRLRVLTKAGHEAEVLGGKGPWDAGLGAAEG